MKTHFNAQIVLVALLLTMFAWTACYASPGSLDYTFGTGGLVKTDLGYVDDGSAVAVYQSGTHAGKIVVAGTVAPVDNSWNDFAVARYNSDGTLDNTFGTGGKATVSFNGYDRAYAVLIQPDDKIILVGNTQIQVNSLPVNPIAMVRFNANGTLDSSFGSGGKVQQTIGNYSGNWSGAVLQSDGSIAVVGQEQDASAGDNSIFSCLVRFNSSGGFISKTRADFATYYNTGTAQNFPSYEGFAAVTLQSDGKIVAVGYASTKANNYAVMTVARFTAAGALDTTFGTGGKTTVTFNATYSDYASSVRVQSDGKIVIGGRTSLDNSKNNFAVARLTSTGALDTTFNATGKATVDAGGANEANALAIQGDGKILIAGYTGDFGVARFNGDGTLDTTFGTSGIQTIDFGSDDRAYGMALQSDGTIILAGWSGSGLTREFAVTRLNSQSSNMLYGSSTVLQNNNVIAPGASGDIVRVAIITSGDLSSLSATSFTCNTTGTTSVADISSARLYYTGTSAAYSMATPFGSVVATPNGSFTITGTQALAEGTNYFWLAYAVAANATNGNVLDAQCTSVTVGGTTRTPTVIAPAGNRQIFNILATYDIGSHIPEFNGGTNNVPASSLAPGLSATSLTAGAGLTMDNYYPDTGLYLYINWTTSTTPVAEQYFQVKITPDSMKQVTYDKLTFAVAADYYVTGSPNYYGPRTIDLRYSTDNFVSSNILLQTLTWTAANDSFEQHTFSDVDISAIGTRSGPITFRWYGYKRDAAGDPTSAMGFANRTAGPNPSWYTGTGSNIIFKGTVTSINTNPTLAANAGLTLLQTASATTITNAMLRATDAEQAAAALTYTIGTAPTKGTLRKSSSVLGTASTFTQADIDGGLITFTPSGASSGADSFTFTVSDGAGGSIGSTAFNITITVPTADLAVTVTDGTATATPGSSVSYTITVSNAGPQAVTGATVADTFPASLTCTWTCVGAGGGTCTASGAGNITDTVNLPAGGLTTYTALCSISPSATGTLTNTVTVTPPAGTTDSNSANNTATDTDTLIPVADLSITVTDGVTTATPGSTVAYTITVTNLGPSDAKGATVTDTLPVSVTGVTWTSAFSGAGSGNINEVINLPVGGSGTYIVTGTLSASATGTLENTATVSAPAGTTDPNPANNSATDTDTLTATLTVNFGGLGGNKIDSTAPNTDINCLKGDQGSICHMFVPAGTPVTISATTDWKSVFAGWSGDYISSLNPVTITMDGNKAVTGTFDLNYKARLLIADSPQASIQDACDAAASGDTILAQTYFFQEPSGVILGKVAAKTITIKGGYQLDNTNYDTVTGVTTVKGPVAIQQGKLNVERIKIR